MPASDRRPGLGVADIEVIDAAAYRRLVRADRGCGDGPADRPSKYGAIPTEVDGYRFPSRAEARRYGELRMLERSGAITGLELQPAWDLHVQGVRIGRYIADFAYDDPARGRVIEDVKGGKATRTRLYRWKIKHLRAEHGVTVVEIDG